ncbi:MAG: hypothetical protein U0638_15715 [Phycisphaerales bacterium]
MATLLPFGEVRAGDLEWATPSGLKRSFVLHQGDHAFATLEWRSGLGTLAVATTAGGSWTFKRVGFWSPRVTVRRAGATEDEGLFRPTGWCGSSGELRLANEPPLFFEREGFWSATWRFRDGAGATLVRIGDISGVFRWRASLSLADPGDPRAPLLSCLLWYLAVLTYDDEAATAAVVAAG